MGAKVSFPAKEKIWMMLPLPGKYDICARDMVHHVRAHPGKSSFDFIDDTVNLMKNLN
jgi:hypothetical protein